MTGYEDAFRANANEAADCVVRSVASVCGISYLAAYHAFQAIGRKTATGTPEDQMRDALDFLGWGITGEYDRDRMALELRVKKPALADMEGKDWLPRMLVRVNKADHVAPFWGGHVRDWSANTEAQIDKAWIVQKRGIQERRKSAPVIYL